MCSSPTVKKWSEPFRISERTDDEVNVFGWPLVNHPGEQRCSFCDWEGRLVEYVSGSSAERVLPKLYLHTLKNFE